MESKSNATTLAASAVRVTSTFVVGYRRAEAASAASIEIEATREKIRRALAEDATCRRPGVLDGLYGLDTLAPFARLGHGVPAIRHNPWSGPVVFGHRAVNDADFAARLHAAAPFLTTFDLRGNGLVLAGGAASSLLMRSDQERAAMYSPYHDYDLFLVGHASYVAALAAITALGDHLHARWGSLDVYRTQGCVTFYRRNRDGADDNDGDGDGDAVDDPRDSVVQVILRRYSTIGEVIHGFDLGSSSVAWDGQRVVLTGLGKLAAEHGVNVLNLVARRLSYELRIARYFQRGYDLVLPDLDNNLAALHGHLPYLYAADLEAGGCCSCHLKARALYATRPGWENNGRIRVGEADAKADAKVDDAVETSDYALGQVCYGNFRAIYSRNLRAVASDVPRFASLCAHAKYVPGLDVRTIELDLDTPLLAQLVSWSFDHKDGVKLNALKDLLGADRTAMLVLESLTSGKPPSKDTIAQLCADRIRELKARPHKIPFAFMGVEDGTALIGPFPRTAVSPADWYGAAYRPAK